jgi:inhibitor of cysteine peptidase
MSITIEVNEQANGKTVALSGGQVLVVRLPENPTTGYRWVAESNDAMKLEADEYFPNNTGIGAGGTRQLRWSALAPGQSQIILKQKRSWETTGTAIGHFSLVVISK